MTKRIHVVQFVYRFNVEGGAGGIGRFAIELCRSLNPERFDVSLCALGNTGTSFEQEWIKKINSDGIVAFTAADWDEQRPYRSFWGAFSWLRQWVNQNPVDILHSHSEFSDIMVLLLKLHKKPPATLRTIHYGYHVEWRKRPLRRLLLTNFLYPLMFDLEIGVSKSIADRLNRRRMARLVGRQAQYVYNAVDLERFTNIQIDIRKKKKDLKIPEDVPVIGSIGRLTEQKGYAYLIDAAAMILNSLPHAHFLIIGEGELAKSLKEQSNRLGIANNVIFTGPRSDVEDLLSCMDIFASSSLWEGLPTVLMESMASGVPVVATDIPGNSELIRSQNTGWLVPPGDAKQLSETILKAIHSPSLSKKMAENAKYWVKGFSIKTVVKKYENIYLTLT